MSAVVLLAGLVWLPLEGCTPSHVGEAEAPDALVLLRDASSYLWSKQGPDGGWHSDTYAFFRSGQALTPFILDALLQVDETICPRPAGAVDKALEFIRGKTTPEGVLGLADPEVPEYPNYATAFALRCLLRAGTAHDEPLIASMRAYLVSEQYRKENGFDSSSPVFGGWGIGGPRPQGSPGHMDISYTRHVLESLRHAGIDDPPILERVQTFLYFLQRHPTDKRPQPPFGAQNSRFRKQVPYDGGFYFSPVVLPANKGGVISAGEGKGTYYQSYATATCDGVLALLAAGVPAGDERSLAARRWLERHARLDYPEGVPSDDPNRWGAAIHFYHLAVRAEAYEALKWSGDWRERIAGLLAVQRRDDGSFVNAESHLMKEDDPLLCSTLAVIALTRVARSERVR